MKSRSATPAYRAAIDAPARRDIVRAVDAARPIDDILAWLIRNYPHADREWVFAALSAVYDAGFTIAPARQQTRYYRIGLEDLTACPQRVS